MMTAQTPSELLGTGGYVERPCEVCGRPVVVSEMFFADSTTTWPVLCDEHDGATEAIAELEKAHGIDPDKLIAESGIYPTPAVPLPDKVAEFVTNGRLGLFLFADPGNGKTWMINELVRRWCRERRQAALYVTEGSFLDAIYDFKTRRESVHRFKTVPLLVIDDLGSFKQSDWSGGTIGDVLDHRHYLGNGLKTVFVSNFAPDVLRQLDQFADERNFRRIAATCGAATPVTHWRERDGGQS